MLLRLPVAIAVVVYALYGGFVRAEEDSPEKQQARVLLAGMDGKPVGLPFSVKGFNEAAAAFDTAEARRHSWWRRFWS